MANELLVSLLPGDVISFTAGGFGAGTDDPYRTVPFGLGKGISLPAKATTGIYALVRVPNAVALVTGLTVNFVLADDSLNTGVGKNVYVDAVAGVIVSGTTTFDENAITGALVGTTPVAAAVTIPVANAAGTPALVSASIVIPIANMPSLAAGAFAVVRFRRLGLNALDTNTTGRVIVGNVDFRNT